MLKHGYTVFFTCRHILACSVWLLTLTEGCLCTQKKLCLPIVARERMKLHPISSLSVTMPTRTCCKIVRTNPCWSRKYTCETLEHKLTSCIKESFKHRGQERRQECYKLNNRLHNKIQSLHMGIQPPGHFSAVVRTWEPQFGSFVENVNIKVWSLQSSHSFKNNFLIFTQFQAKQNRNTQVIQTRKQKVKNSAAVFADIPILAA